MKCSFHVVRFVVIPILEGKFRPVLQTASRDIVMSVFADAEDIPPRMLVMMVLESMIISRKSSLPSSSISISASTAAVSLRPPD
jgi:hypothetical protein